MANGREDWLDSILPRLTQEELYKHLERSGTVPIRSMEELRKAIAGSRQPSDLDSWDARYQETVRAAGGDPDELLPGNKPRWTMEEDGSLKDHLTGRIYRPEDERGEAL